MEPLPILVWEVEIDGPPNPVRHCLVVLLLVLVLGHVGFSQMVLSQSVQSTQRVEDDHPRHRFIEHDLDLLRCRRRRSLGHGLEG